MELYYIGVIMQFEMKVHFTADHEGKFLNNSPSSPVNVFGHLPDKIDQSELRKLLAKVQIDPSHKVQKSEIEMRSLAIMSLIQLGMVVGLNMI